MKEKNSEALSHSLLYGVLALIITSFVPNMNYRHTLVAVLMFLFVYRSLSSKENNPQKNLFNLGIIFLVIGGAWYVAMRSLGIVGDNGVTITLVTGVFYLIFPKVIQVRYTKPVSTLDELLKKSKLVNKRDLISFLELGDITESGYYKVTEILSLEDELDSTAGNYLKAMKILDSELKNEIDRQKRIFNKEETDKESEEDYVEQSVNDSLIDEIKDI